MNPVLPHYDFSHAVTLSYRCARHGFPKVGPVKGGGDGYRGYQMSGGSSSSQPNARWRAGRSLKQHKSPISRKMIASKNAKG